MAKTKTTENNTAEITSGATVAESLKLIENTMEDREPTKYLPTGNIGFDLAITEGKGLPIGSSILFWADPGCGKSTLVGDISKRLLDCSKKSGEPFKVLYLAAEGSEELMRGLGLGKYMDSKDFIYVEKSLTWRQVEIFYNEILNGQNPACKDVKLIVIDSVNNILSDANTEKSVADGDFGTKSRERSLFYSKYFPVCKEKGISTFLIAQVRHNQDAVGLYADKRKAAVSYADKHNVDIILKCSKSTSDKELKKEDTKTIFGNVTGVKEYILKMTSSAADCKNRYCEGLPSEILMLKGKGADNSYVIRKLLEAYGFIVASGSWFSFNEQMCETFKFPNTKLRKEAIMDIIRNNAGSIVAFLKDKGYYGLQVQQPTEEIVEDTVDTGKQEPKKGKGK